MCFYHDDADWCASVSEITTAVATDRDKCGECGRVILRGEPVKSLYQQEREDGEYCEPDKGRHVNGCEPDGDDGTYQCEHEGPGETFDLLWCEPCDKLIRAIVAHEEAEGCKGAEARPGYGELRDVFTERFDDGQEYLDAARAMFPELAASGYLDRWTDTYGLWAELASQGPDLWTSGVYAHAVCPRYGGGPTDFHDLGGEG